MSHWLEKVLELLKAPTSDLRELARIAGADPDTFYRGIDPSKLDLDGQNIDGIDFSEHLPTDDGADVIRSLLEGSLINIGEDENIVIDPQVVIDTIKMARRQEERISLLLRLLLQHRSHALKLINMYGQDKAKYANIVVSNLRDVFENEEHQESLLGANHKIRLPDEALAHLVHSSFNRSLPTSRAAILYFMSAHLSHNPKINTFLQAKFANSYSIFLRDYRSEIDSYLKQPTKFSWLELLEQNSR